MSLYRKLSEDEIRNLQRDDILTFADRKGQPIDARFLGWCDQVGYSCMCWIEGKQIICDPTAAYIFEAQMETMHEMWNYDN